MRIVRKYSSTSLVVRILIGLLLGASLGLLVPGMQLLPLIGKLFIGALKGIAPVLVFTLVLSALSKGKHNLDERFGMVIFLYMISTLLAAVTAVVASFMFPQTLILNETATAGSVPGNVWDAVSGLVLSMVSNPVRSLTEGNYIGILFWAVIFGAAARVIASDATKKMLADVAAVVSEAVRWIIQLAPFGIMGIVYESVSTNGLSVFTVYGKLLLLLVGCMLFVALVIDPLLASIAMKTNAYPLVIRCLRESGITAFFTRSSAANIPVNMELCRRLGLDEEMYAVSIPLGATINMDGAAVTISVMALAAAHTMNIEVSFAGALMLALISTVAACGSSGVAGGSLLLIPMACSLFGISQDVAMQVVAVGFIISVIQDSVETALNSSGDVLFAATAEYRQWKKEGKSLPVFLGGTTEVEID